MNTKYLVRLFIIKIIFVLSIAWSYASDPGHQPKTLIWPFDGMFGTFDRQAAQRGAQVYFEVCSVCHGLYNLYYRNLIDLGFSEDEVKEIAKKYTLADGPNEDGEMFERPAVPSDKFVRPYANEQAARAANNGSYPVDLSLIIKSRKNGADYLHALLTGYSEPPKTFHLMNGLYYNPYFEGGQLAMPPPLSEGQVTYLDGTVATIDQMSKDVAIFLQWAAEPEMEQRKSMGIKVMMFLAVFTILFYVAKKRLWKNIK